MELLSNHEQENQTKNPRLVEKKVKLDTSQKTLVIYAEHHSNSSMTKKKKKTIRGDGFKVMISVRCPIYERERLETIRKKMEMSISDYVNRLIVEGNNRYEKKV